MGDDGSETAYAHHAVIVTTQRLLLRPRRPGEEIAMAALLANPAISPNLCATIPADHGKPLAIVDRLTGRLVGAADHGVTGLGSGIEVTLWIGEPDCGRGYATEAAYGLVDHAFRDESVAVVWCSNRVTNARAHRVIEKCGFQFRGNGMVRLSGRGAFPIERFALDRRNWSSLRSWGAANEPGSRGNAARETAA